MYLTSCLHYYYVEVDVSDNLPPHFYVEVDVSDNLPPHFYVEVDVSDKLPPLLLCGGRCI